MGSDFLYHKKFDKVKDSTCAKSMSQELMSTFNLTRYLGCKYLNTKHETVLHRDTQTPRRELKIRRTAEYF